MFLILDITTAWLKTHGHNKQVETEALLGSHITSQTNGNK